MSVWLNYFDSVRERRSFRIEAEAFAERLEQEIALSPSMRLLDFGCGFGFVAKALAPKIGEVLLWDASPQMRARAASTIGPIANARLLDDPPRPATRDRFDLIVVNSVIQYMNAPEVDEWFALWKQLLAPGGRIVIADIIPPHLKSYTDILDQVIFGARRGFLATALKEDVAELRPYWTMRRARPLTRFSRRDLERLARNAGLVVEFLPRNLTCRTARVSLLLRRADTEAGLIAS